MTDKPQLTESLLDKKGKPTEREENIANIVKTNPIQIVFFLFGVATMIWMVPFFIACYNFVRYNMEHKPETYEYPEFKDFWIPAASSIVFYGIQLFFERVFFQILMPFIKPCKSDQEKEKRAMKASKCLQKCVFYIGAVVWGFYIFLDQPFMPKLLGGSGDYNNGFNDFPYQQHASGLKNYYLVLMGYHVGALIAHFVHSKQNDFIEMGLHHIVTVQLVGGSYLINIWEIGAVIFLIHDISDITISLCKALSETTFQKTAAGLFIANMAVWLYTRMIVFPYLIYVIFATDVEAGWSMTLPTIGMLLSCLFILHCYWFSLFCKMTGRYFKDGKCEDMQNKTVAVESKNNQESA